MSAQDTIETLEELIDHERSVRSSNPTEANEIAVRIKKALRALNRRVAEDAKQFQELYDKSRRLKPQNGFFVMVKERDEYNQILSPLRIAKAGSTVPEEHLRVIDVPEKDIPELITAAADCAVSVEDYISELVETRMADVRQLREEAAQIA